MRAVIIIVAVAACARTQPPPPQAMRVETEVIEYGTPGVAPVGYSAQRAQPAAMKLRLGHYRNAKLGIGVTIDLTERTENVADIDPAKLRFDGEDIVYRLEGQHGPRDRIDYVRDRKLVMLHVWSDGRRAVYVPDPDGGPSSEMIELVRDADADPL